MSIYFHDIECYPNHFSDIFLDVKTPNKLINDYIEADINQDKELKSKLFNQINPTIFIINWERNDILNYISFLKNCNTLIGYNNLNYDDLICKFILSRKWSKKEDCNTPLYEFNEKIIHTKDKFSDPVLIKAYRQYVQFSSIDPMLIAFSSTQRRALKQTLINLNWYRIQDLPYPPGHDIPYYSHAVEELLDYEFNDILGTRHLYTHIFNDIKLRLDINKKFDVNVTNSSRSNIGDKMFKKFYLIDNPDIDPKDFNTEAFRTNRGNIKLNNIISPKIKFLGSDILVSVNTAKSGRKANFVKLAITNTNDLLEYVKRLVVFGTKDVNLRVKIKDLVLDIKSGGLHSVDEAGIFQEDKNYSLIDADVGSFYPSIMVEFQACPKHLRLNFIKRLKWIKEMRIKSKKEGDKVSAENFKITLNAWYGKTNDKDSPLFDTLVTLTVTINGQLLLLKLIESLSINDIEVISANTDGVLCKVPKDKLDLYYKICKDWEDEVNFELEYTEYDKYIRRDVNNYTARKKKDGMLKNKGIFAWDDMDITKGYNPSIIAKALRAYFYDGISSKEIIHNCKEIYDFCISQKINKSRFIPILKKTSKGDITSETLQPTNRFFISKKGGYLFKDYLPEYDIIVDKFTKPYTQTTSKKTGQLKRTIRKPLAIAKNRTITIFNNYYRVNDFSEYNVDYKDYIDKTNEIIDIIEPTIDLFSPCIKKD